MRWLTYSASLGKKSSNGGGFDSEKTKVQAGVEFGVEILSSGVFVSQESSLDRIVVELCGDPGRFADGTNITTCFPLWRLQLNLKAAQLPDCRESINMSCQQ